MEFFLLYAFVVSTRLAELAGELLIGVCVFGAIAGVFGTMAYYIEGWKEGPALAKAAYRFFKIPVFVAFLFYTLTPTKDDLYFISGGGLSLMAVQNEKVQQIPENAAKAVNAFLQRLEAKEE